MRAVIQRINGAEITINGGETRKVGEGRSLEDIKGDMLIVSNITLSADMKHGRRPDFSRSASPSEALRLYNYFVEQVKNQPIGKVCTGEFGAHMHVSVENDGPVNIIIDTERIGK